MYLLQLWKDSLLFFKPSSVKLFTLISLKRFFEGMKIWLKHFWWLLVLSLFLNEGILYKIFGSVSFYFYFAKGLISFAILFSLILSIRPSVKKKNFKYFLDYKLHFILSFFSTVVFAMLDFFMGYVLGGRAIGHVNALLFVVSIFLMFNLFLSNSRAGLKDLVLSFWRALKMFVFNFPFF